jgi:hypothetical protein
MSQQNALVPAKLFSYVRRNHALEHATLQVLAEKFPGGRMAGYSTFNGFWVLGQVEIADLQKGIEEAQKRLRGGERRLAIHPNCGTNFAFTGLLAGFAAWLAMLGSGNSLRKKLDRLPLVTTLVTLVMILTYPLGAQIQEKVTTDANLGDLRVVQIDCFERQGMRMHRVVTRDMPVTA